jgi:hypothetical protein
MNLTLRQIDAFTARANERLKQMHGDPKSRE